MGSRLVVIPTAKGGAGIKFIQDGRETKRAKADKIKGGAFMHGYISKRKMLLPCEQWLARCKTALSGLQLPF